MTTSVTIPEALEPELLRLAGELNPATSRRYTTRELAAWLKTTHGVECSHMAVVRCLRAQRAEIATELRELLREQLLSSMAAEWEALDGLSAEVLEDAAEHRKEKRTKEFLGCVAELRKIAATRARVAGVERIEVSGEVDLTTGGKPFSLYLPAEDDDAT